MVLNYELSKVVDCTPNRWSEIQPVRHNNALETLSLMSDMLPFDSKMQSRNALRLTSNRLSSRAVTR